MTAEPGFPDTTLGSLEHCHADMQHNFAGKAIAHLHAFGLQFWHSMAYTVMIRGAANCAGLDPRIEGSKVGNKVVRAIYTLDPAQRCMWAFSPRWSLGRLRPDTSCPRLGLPPHRLVDG